jgi:hypothetical protein
MKTVKRVNVLDFGVTVPKKQRGMIHIGEFSEVIIVPVKNTGCGGCVFFVGLRAGDRLAWMARLLLKCLP